MLCDSFIVMFNLFRRCQIAIWLLISLQWIWFTRNGIRFDCMRFVCICIVFTEFVALFISIVLGGWIWVILWMVFSMTVLISWTLVMSWTIVCPNTIWITILIRSIRIARRTGIISTAILRTSWRSSCGFRPENETNEKGVYFSLT